MMRRKLLIPLLLLLASCSRTTDRAITITVKVPEGTGTVYLAGNRPELGPWDPKKYAMEGSGTTRAAKLRLPDGFELEYKFTLGSWDRESLGPTGAIPPNFRLKADSDKQVTHDITAFKRETAYYFDTWKESGVLGRLEYWRDVRSKHLATPRHIEIWLPPEYDANPDTRFPVIYMHDGQNLFDPRIANTGVDWGVDEAIVRNVKAGKIPPVIVVGVWCTDDRLREYSPWDLGPSYARFLIEELMPQINEKFRTKTGPQHTATMGASMGGLISFWLCWQHADVFGMGGCLSTHFAWSGQLQRDFSAEPLIEREMKNSDFPRTVRLYLDYGTQGLDSNYEPMQTKVNQWLISKGLKEGEDFISKKFEGADHNETAWRARVDEPLVFLLGPLK